MTDEQHRLNSCINMHVGQASDTVIELFPFVWFSSVSTIVRLVWLYGAALLAPLSDWYGCMVQPC